MSDTIDPATRSAARDRQGPAAALTFGYKQDLRRTLRFFGLFGMAFSIISITTGIFLNYGASLGTWGPAAIWTWPVVGMGQLLIALVVAELGTRMPLAGYAYQWSSRLVNSTYGWFVGFAGLMYMSVGGAGILLLIESPLLLSEFGIDTPSGRDVLITSVIVMLIPGIINVVSIQLASRINGLAVIAEIVGLVGFGIVVFVLRATGDKPVQHVHDFLFSTTGLAHHPTWYAIVIAGLLGSYTLVGFELAADMAEEAVDARFTVPRSIIVAVAGAVVLGMVALITFTEAIPDLKAVQTSPLPLVTITGYWLTPWLVKVFVGVVVFSMFAIGVVGTAAQTRLAYSMGRDNMLPFSRRFARVNERTQTPIFALVVFTVISIGFLVYGYNQASAYSSLVGATAVIPFIIYLLITVAYAFKRRLMDEVPGAFSLGASAPVVIGLVIAWCIAIILSLSLPHAFYGSDRIVGGAAVLALIWYLLVLRGRLRRREAGVERIEATLEAGRAPAEGTV